VVIKKMQLRIASRVPEFDLSWAVKGRLEIWRYGFIWQSDCEEKTSRVIVHVLESVARKRIMETVID
jgi:hypothetical protein